MSLNASMNYKERNSGSNFAEEFFEEYCKDYFIRRIGFDEKNDNIPHFYNMSRMLRNLPDYYVDTGSKQFVVNVKGTDCIKEKEYDIISLLASAYSSDDCMLLYAFCFKGNKRPIFLYPFEVINTYDQKKDQTWHDGVIYRSLGIR